MLNLEQPWVEINNAYKGREAGTSVSVYLLAVISRGCKCMLYTLNTQYYLEVSGVCCNDHSDVLQLVCALYDHKW